MLWFSQGSAWCTVEFQFEDNRVCRGLICDLVLHVVFKGTLSASNSRVGGSGTQGAAEQSTYETTKLSRNWCRFYYCCLSRLGKTNSWHEPEAKSSFKLITSFTLVGISGLVVILFNFSERTMTHSECWRMPSYSHRLVIGLVAVSIGWSGTGRRVLSAVR